MQNYQNLSMLDIAVAILKEQGKMKIQDLMNQTLAAKSLPTEDIDYKTQLYLDITTSSLFVYLGDEEWDLKERQSLELFDRDGAEYNNTEDEVEEDYEGLKFEDDFEEDTESSDEYDVYDIDYDNEEDYEEDDDDIEDSDEELIGSYHEENDDFDEDKYNNYMDDFEDMYDDN